MWAIEEQLEFTNKASEYDFFVVYTYGCHNLNESNYLIILCNHNFLVIPEKQLLLLCLRVL